MKALLRLNKRLRDLFFPYKLSYYATGGPYYAWATCGYLTHYIFFGLFYY